MTAIYQVVVLLVLSAAALAVPRPSSIFEEHNGHREDRASKGFHTAHVDVSKYGKWQYEWPHFSRFPAHRTSPYGTFQHHYSPNRQADLSPISQSWYPGLNHYSSNRNVHFNQPRTITPTTSPRMTNLFTIVNGKLISFNPNPTLSMHQNTFQENLLKPYHAYESTSKGKRNLNTIHDMSNKAHWPLSNTIKHDEGKIHYNVIKTKATSQHAYNTNFQNDASISWSSYPATDITESIKHTPNIMPIVPLSTVETGNFSDLPKAENKTTTLILKPSAKAVAGKNGIAIAAPVSNAVVRRGQKVKIHFEPEAVAIVGPGGFADAHSDLYITYVENLTERLSSEIL